MALSYAPTTELEAVNEMLTSIGSSPLSSLEDISDIADAVIAQQTLHNVSREIQSEGWHFNTEIDYTLTPDAGDGELDLPGNTLSCDTTGSNASLNVAVRGTKLYDLEEHTYDFSAYSAGVEVELILFLQWDELPEYARRYIYIRAARIFAKKQLASDSLDTLTEEDEIRAFANFKSREATAADHNVLSNFQVQEAWLRI